MADTPPKIELPNHEPILNEETARLLLRMLVALDAEAGTTRADLNVRPVGEDPRLPDIPHGSESC